MMKRSGSYGFRQLAIVGTHIQGDKSPRPPPAPRTTEDHHAQTTALSGSHRITGLRGDARRRQSALKAAFEQLAQNTPQSHTVLKDRKAGFTFRVTAMNLDDNKPSPAIPPHV